MPERSKRPVPFKELDKYFQARPAVRNNPIKVQHRFHIAAEREPVISTQLVAVERGDGKKSWEIIVDIDGAYAGARAQPMALKGTATKIEKRKVSEESLAEHLTSFIPEHLDFNPKPQKLLKSIKRIPSTIGKRRVATTIFGSDNRRAFEDTSYPWCTVGLVETNRGTGSGVMIGPRHLLTVSHIIDWSAPEGFVADWVRFTPSYFDGNAPFGEAYGTNIYWYLQEDGDGFITGEEVKFDYVVVVLDRRLGESTGYMGARGYDDDWDSLDVWQHMGYPSDLNSGQRPTWQGGFRVDGTDDAAQSILHKADVFPGQSGGPVFGFWEGDVGPRAIAVQSWQNVSDNGASGSMDLRDLVAQARQDFA